MTPETYIYRIGLLTGLYAGYCFTILGLYIAKMVFGVPL